MPRISKQARHLKKAREIEVKKLEAMKNDKKRKIDKILNYMDEPKLENTLELLIRLNNTNSGIALSKEDRQRMDLISSVQQLSDKEISAANHLITTMCYPKGPNESKLISPYLQNMAIMASSFGILVDESTQGEAKYFVLCYQFWNQKNQIPVITVTHLENIPRCNANTVSDTVIKYIQQDGIFFDKCALWVIDNTAYMSGEKK
ncbi:3891_t:CDS:2, partial [Funneliformis geosporum]